MWCGFFIIMAKGLPYFKFTPTEWLTGDICFEEFDVQGLFINICALYWQRDGILTLEDIERRYKKPTALDSLLGRFLSVNDGLITINFLDEQFVERKHISVTNSENGSKGGRPKTLGIKPTANPPLTGTKPKESQQEEEESEEEKKKNKRKNFSPPTLDEVKKYFKDSGYTEQSAEKAFNHYNVADWHDTNGNKVRSWKQKMSTNWFKDENKQPVSKPLYDPTQPAPQPKGTPLQ